MARYRTISMETTEDGFHEILTLEKIPAYIGRMFGCKPKIVKFYGHGTVWYSYPEFERECVSMEYMLSDIWTKQKYLREKL